MKPAWCIKDFLEATDEALLIDGVSAIDLAHTYQTPLFVLSEKRIRSNLERLLRIRNVISCQIKVCYAAKANSNLRVLRAVREAGGDIEVNSGGELFMALTAGFAPGQIIFNGTSKTEKEISEAITAGIYAIQADSLFEVELIETTARKLNLRANVSLRLVPEIETETLHGLQTALLTSKFGMMPEEALAAFKRWRPGDEFLNLCGIHLHIGSQNPGSDAYVQALTALFENLKEIYDTTGHKLRHLNIGGGFPVNYLADDSNAASIDRDQKLLFSADLDPAEIIGTAWKAVARRAAEANASGLINDIELLVEPGRSVIADAVVCLTTVRNKKSRPVNSSDSGNDERPNRDVWLMTDAGFNILLSMETYKWYYHLVSAERALEDHVSPYKVAGPLCDGGDVYFDIEGRNRLPDYRNLPENVKVGEVLALLNCGAYSLSQMFPYNGRELPAAVMIDREGRVELIRTRQTYQDLLANQVLPDQL